MYFLKMYFLKMYFLKKYFGPPVQELLLLFRRTNFHSLIGHLVFFKRIHHWHWSKKNQRIRKKYCLILSQLKWPIFVYSFSPYLSWLDFALLDEGYLSAMKQKVTICHGSFLTRPGKIFCGRFRPFDFFQAAWKFSRSRWYITVCPMNDCIFLNAYCSAQKWNFWMKFSLMVPKLSDFCLGVAFFIVFMFWPPN